MDTDLLSLLGLPPSTLKWFLQACCCSVAICLLHQLTCGRRRSGPWSQLCSSASLFPTCVLPDSRCSLWPPGPRLSLRSAPSHPCTTSSPSGPGHLTAQGGTGPCLGLYLPQGWLLPGKHHEDSRDREGNTVRGSAQERFSKSWSHDRAVLKTWKSQIHHENPL